MNTEGTQPEIPNNASGPRVPEVLFRRFLAYQLGQIAKTVDYPNVTFIADLFSSHGADVVRDVKAWLREHPNIPVTINYPRQDTSLPFICVVNGAETEDAGGQFLDDHGGVARYGVLGGGTPEQQLSSLNAPAAGVAQFTRRIISIPQKHNTAIYIAAQDVNLAMYLYAIVKALLIVNKGDFDKYGDIRDLVISGKDLEHHPEFFPTFAYFKVFALQYNSTFDVPMPPETTILGGIDIGLKVATQFTLAIPGVEEDVGDATVTDVPSE